MKTWFEKYYGYPAPVATKQEVILVFEKEYRKPGPKLGSKRKVIHGVAVDAQVYEYLQSLNKKTA